MTKEIQLSLKDKLRADTGLRESCQVKSINTRTYNYHDYFFQPLPDVYGLSGHPSKEIINAILVIHTKGLHKEDVWLP